MTPSPQPPHAPGVSNVVDLDLGRPTGPPQAVWGALSPVHALRTDHEPLALRRDRLLMDDLRDRMAEVLVHHQRKNSRECLCGWGQLGRSHAAHVADAVLTVVGPELERLRKELAEYRTANTRMQEINTRLAGRAEKAEAERDALKAKLARHVAAVWTVPGEEPETVIAERDAQRDRADRLEAAFLRLQGDIREVLASELRQYEAKQKAEAERDRLRSFFDDMTEQRDALKAANDRVRAWHHPMPVYDGDPGCLEDGACVHEEDYPLGEEGSNGGFCPHTSLAAIICFACSYQDTEGEGGRWPRWGWVLHVNCATVARLDTPTSTEGDR